MSAHRQRAPTGECGLLRTSRRREDWQYCWQFIGTHKLQIRKASYTKDTKLCLKKKRMKFTEILEEHRKGRIWTFEWLDTASSNGLPKSTLRECGWVRGDVCGVLQPAAPHICVLLLFFWHICDLMVFWRQGSARLEKSLLREIRGKENHDMSWQVNKNGQQKTRMHREKSHEQ